MPMSNRDLIKICQRLDDLFIQYLDLVDTYQYELNLICRSFKQAHIDLAHAKYTMGTGKVSKWQYDERMKAILRITTECSVNEKDDEPPLFVLKSPLIDSRIDSSINSSGLPSLRNRHHSTSESQHEKGKNYEVGDKPVDPLQWFGVLNSSSLKTAQGGFHEAVDALVKIANSRRNIEIVEKSIRETWKLKRDLMRGLKERENL